MLNLKKSFGFVLILITVFTICSCGNSKTAKTDSDKKVTSAINTLTEYWSSEYANKHIGDKYLEIINTRIVNIKDTTVEDFQDIDYVVEFSLLSNFIDAQPNYYVDSFPASVIVRKDGTEVAMLKSPFNQYTAMKYTFDYSDIIESIENFHGQYDQVLTVK